jgi:hypothetical protein
MKNLKTLFGIIALAVVIMLALGSCVINVPDDTPSYSLNGYWNAGSGSTTRYSFEGRTAYYSRMGSSALTQSAVNKSYIKVGDQAYRSLSNSSGRTWTGEVKLISYYASSPNTATGTSWEACTINLASNGQSMEVYCSESDTTRWTLYRD